MLEKQLDELGGKPQSNFDDHYKSKRLTKISRILRKDATNSEKLLWEALRKRKLGGMKFRRQHPIASNVLDFYCHEKQLAIEIDGGYHRQQDIQEQDRHRQELIENHGIRFYRCTSHDVETNLSEVLGQILDAANKIPHRYGEGIRQLAERVR